MAQQIQGDLDVTRNITTDSLTVSGVVTLPNAAIDVSKITGLAPSATTDTTTTENIIATDFIAPIDAFSPSLILDTDTVTEALQKTETDPIRWTAADQMAMLSLTDIRAGDTAIRQDTIPYKEYRLDTLPASTLGNWTQIGDNSGGGSNNASDINIDGTFTPVDTDIVQNQSVKEGLEAIQGQMNAIRPLIASGIQFREATVTPTDGTGNIVLTPLVGITFTISETAFDGYTLQAGDTILLREETLPQQNGKYTINSLTPTTIQRSPDFNTEIEIENSRVIIESGNTLAGANYQVLTLGQPFTLDTTPIVFQFVPIFIPNDYITEAKLADDSVSTDKIVDANVTDVKIATGINAAKLADGTVSNTTFQYINTLSSNAQTQLNGKVPTSTTINGHALSSNVTVTATDVGLGNVPNVDATYLGNDIIALSFVPNNSAIVLGDNGISAFEKAQGQINNKQDILINPVTGQSSSVDSEIALFSGTSGQIIKRATGSGIAKIASGVLSTATSGTDYAPATSGTSILKGNGSGGFSNAISGTDYQAPITNNSITNAQLTQAGANTWNGNNTNSTANKAENSTAALTEATSSVLTITGAANALLNPASIQVKQATTSQSGYVSSTDWNTFNSKEPSITSGTTSQYWRGDKTFQNLTTAVVSELTNLYFTAARAIASVLTGYTKGAGTISSSDSILQAIQKLDGNADLKAPLASPTLTGTPTAPTAASSTNTTQLATTAFVQTAVSDATTGLYNDRGNFDASGNLFPSTGGSGTAGAIKKGNIWTISVAGTLGGSAVTAGDTARALIDTPGQTSSNWALNETNIGYVPENLANKNQNSGYAGLDSSGNFVQNSDKLPEGSTNLFFTGARTIASLLTGFTAAGTRTAILATDTILQAFGKAQKYFNDLATVAFSGSASDLSTGTLPAARLPNPTASTLGGIQSLAAVTSKWINSISTSGVPNATQPAASDISGLATSATTDTTNATNITSGTLPSAQLPIVPITKGGTGQSTANAAFQALSPATTLGDTIYSGSSNTPTRLAGNTTATKQFYTQTGTGSGSAAPAWGAISLSDVPNIPTVKKQITQTTHGFSAGQILALNSSGVWILAKADAAATISNIHVVDSVVDTNNFVIARGYSSAFSSLTNGSNYWLSDSAAGTAVSTPPSTVGSVIIQLLTADSTTSGYFWPGTPSAVSYQTTVLAVLTYEVSSGTQGGTATSGSFLTRPLNTEDDPLGIVTLSANQFTLAAGTYRLTSRQIFHGNVSVLNSCRGKIRNITDSSDIRVSFAGRVALPSGSSGSIEVSTPIKEFTITSSKTYELQYRVETTATTNGLGLAASFGVNEIYAAVEILKLL